MNNQSSSKTVVITGGNGGIGKATAVALATKGYRVIIHGHHPQTTMDAYEEIKLRSKNSQVEMIVGDMSSVAGMKNVSRAIMDKTDKIDELVLCTGKIMPKRVLTADGMDTAFATQYLCRFATVQSLMPLLKKAGQARIAHAGAPTMKKASIHFDDLSLKNNFSMIRSMGQAMLSTHLFVQEFAKRHTDNTVLMNMHHVGIARTGIGRETNFFFRTLIKTAGTTPDKAARNTVYLSDNNEVNYSGYFLPKPGKPQVKQHINFDPAVAEKLWNVSMELVA